MGADDLQPASSFTGRIERFPNHQGFDEEGLVGRAKSTSDMPRGREQWAAAERELRELFHQRAQNGVFTVRYQTQAHCAQLAT